MCENCENEKDKETVENVEDEKTDDVEEEVDLGDDWLTRRRKRRLQKEKDHKDLIRRLIGSEIRIDSMLILPDYYGGLLGWSLKTHIAEDGWKVIKTEGYEKDKPPFYMDVDVSYGIKQNHIFQGVLVLEKNEEIIAVSIDSCPPNPNATLVVTGPERIKPVVEGFKDAVEKIAKERNFYRGGKLSFYGLIFFIDVSGKSWSDLILDPDTKDSIWNNSIGFLNNSKRLKEFGLPIKRGLLMVGQPGTGKTLACKGILAASGNITCITTRSDALESPNYLHELYELAEDLSPCIVMIEDIDLICQEREESHYMRGSALLTLLSVLDGVEERDGIVTIGTTNSKDTLDDAIAKRPSRFDRIIEFPKPSLAQRVDLVTLLCKSIPLDAHTQRYLAERTENFTPAQCQEVIYSLAIDYCQKNEGPKPSCLICSRQEVDNAIVKIDRDNRQQNIGFNLPLNGSVKRYGVNTPASNERSE